MNKHKKNRTISYCIYCPDYIPLQSKLYHAETLKKAKRIAKNLGIGSEIVASLNLTHSNGSGLIKSIYELELRDGYFVKFNFKTKFVDGHHYYKNTTGIKVKL